MRLRHATALPFLLATAACIESQPPPDPLPQVTVPYGAKIYLKDGTIESTPSRCRLLGAVASMVQTGTTATSTTVGGDLIEDDRLAYNCYVNVTPGSVTVDTVEVTNELFQLCVDSGVCKKPDPADVDKLPVCSDEGLFDKCPVVSVRQAEATRFCEFVGRRLPTGIEAIAIRQANAPQIPDDVKSFPTGNMVPGGTCSEAVLKSCGKPQPISIEESGAVVGAARLDKTTQGVYDLTGNASEWSSDLIPIIRGGAEMLPWFCTAPLPGDPNAEPVCPSGEVCIFGTYRHVSDGRVRDRPLCLTDKKLSFASGSVGAAFGGNYATSTPEVSRAGTFVRSERDQPNTETALGDVGLRCVDVSGHPGTGIVPVPQP